jgi:hypothetical protein
MTESNDQPGICSKTLLQKERQKSKKKEERKNM